MTPLPAFKCLPKQLFYPDKRRNCTRYLLSNILEKLKLDMTSGDRTSMRWCAPNQYGPTRNLRLHCLKLKKIPGDIAKRIDEIAQSASSPNLAATHVNLNELPDLETISSKHIPTLRFISENFG